MFDLIFGNIPWVLGGLGALVLGVAAIFLRKSGSDAEKAKQAKADAKAAQTINTVRNDVRNDTETELDKRLGKFK